MYFLAWADVCRLLDVWMCMCMCVGVYVSTYAVCMVVCMCCRRHRHVCMCEVGVCKETGSKQQAAECWRALPLVLSELTIMAEVPLTGPAPTPLMLGRTNPALIGHSREHPRTCYPGTGVVLELSRVWQMTMPSWSARPALCASRCVQGPRVPLRSLDAPHFFSTLHGVQPL